MKTTLFYKSAIFHFGLHSLGSIIMIMEELDMVQENNQDFVYRYHSRPVSHIYFKVFLDGQFQWLSDHIQLAVSLQITVQPMVSE